MSDIKYNYLFVSDFHIAMGANKVHGNYAPREDFFYDAEFYRFLKWADKDENRKDGKPWQLVFVGDCFDFLPVELAWIKDLTYWVDELGATLTSYNEVKTREVWKRFFAETILPKNYKDELINFFVSRKLVKVKAKDLGKLYRDQVKKRAIDEIEPVEREALFAIPADSKFHRGEKKRKIDQIEWQEDKLRLPRWAEKASGHRNLKKRNKYGGFLRPPKPPTGLEYITRMWHRNQLLKLRRQSLHEYQFELFLTKKASIEKFENIYTGHREFFTALAWWLEKGHQLMVMVGNHDLELCWPEVQQRFKDLLYEEYQQRTPIDSKEEVDEETFKKRIDFRNWFYYKPGVFYAEHGHQYDNGVSVANMLDPFWVRKVGDKEETLLNPSFGNLGSPIVSRLEDAFPHWENVGRHGYSLTKIIRTYPWRYFRILADTLSQYSKMIRELLKGTRDERKEVGPTRTQFIKYQKKPGHEKLPMKLIRDLYFSWDRPLLLYRGLATIIAYFMKIAHWPMKVFSWILQSLRVLLSPRGFLVFLAALLVGIFIWPDYFGLCANWFSTLTKEFGDSEKIKTILGILGSGIAAILMGMLVSGFKDTAIAYLQGKDEKRFQLALYGEEKYIHEAGRETVNIFQKHSKSPVEYKRASERRRKETILKDDLPRYYIFGHDHIPSKVFMQEKNDLKGEKSAYYFNTGSWLSWFAGEDLRRLRTGGGDLEFTFLEIYAEKKKNGKREEYEAELRRWNDDAERAEEQLVIEPVTEKDVLVKVLAGPILFLACLLGTIGLVIGAKMEKWGLGSVVGIVVGAFMGWALHLGAQRKLAR